ncbi:MAG: hypothetical protein ACSHWW_13440 [Nonlabens sp.]|uniref:hypothetical protein n=1 Tax=Nonlabens sp. TaxID=1888209 RepID=UPI003EF60838
MKKLYVAAIALCMAFTTYAQVGIGTVSPNADLEIVARTGVTGADYNGVTIPKVTSLPSTVPPSGTILYLDSGSSTAGFYFSNGTAFQNVTDILSDNGIGTFYQAGTTTIAENTTGPIERSGRISIGTSSNAAMLTLDNTGTSSFNRRGIRILGDYDGTDDYYGIQVNHDGASGDATAISYGVYADIGPNSLGDKTGLYSEITPSNPASVTAGVHVLTRNGAPGGSTVYGVRSEVGNVGGASTSYGYHTELGDNTAASQTNYGLYANIGGATARGTKYGVFSAVANTGTENAYSGWFQGPAFAIRNSDSTDGYTLPVDSGTAGQVLTTDGTGVAAWSTLTADGDGDSNNEGNLTVTNEGTDQAGIVSDAGANETKVTIRAQANSGISISQNIAGGFINIATANTLTQTVASVNGGPSLSATPVGDNYFIRMNPTAGNVEFLLPDPTAVPGRSYVLFNTSTTVTAVIYRDNDPATPGNRFQASNSSATSGNISSDPNNNTKTLKVFSDGVNWIYGSWGF